MRSFGVKYQITWENIKGVTCRIDISYPDYSGNVIYLTPSSTPFHVGENDDANPFTPVRGQSGTIGIIIESSAQLSLMSEIIPDTYNTALVTAYRDNHTCWIGFINPAAFTQPWVATPFAVQIPVYDMVQALYYERMPTSMRTGEYSFGQIFCTAIESIFGEEEQALSVVLESDFTDNNPVSNFMRYHVPQSYYFEFVNNDTDAGQNFSGMSYGEAFENILSLFGMCLRNYSNTFFFQLLYSPRGDDYSMMYVKHTSLLDMQDVEGIAEGSYEPTWYQSAPSSVINVDDAVRDDGSISINQSKNGISVNFKIDLMGDLTYIMIPKYDEEDTTVVNWDDISTIVFTGFPDNCTGYAEGCELKAETYEETDEQSPDYGTKTVNINANFTGVSADLSSVRSYLGQDPGTYPTIPEAGAGIATTNIVVGAIACQYRRADESNMKNAIFMSGGITGLYSGSEQTPVIFSMQTPAAATLKDGTLKFSFNVFAFRNDPLGVSHDTEYFRFIDYSGWIYYAISIGNWRYTGRTADPWVQQDSEINVSHNIADMGNEKEIPITSEMSGIIKLSIFGMFRGGDHELAASTFGYTDIFYMFPSLDLTFTPNQTSETVNDRTENLYYEEASGYGEIEKILLSIGSNQNNRKANNIILDENGDTVSKIVYNDGTEQHPERHLARNAALYYRNKQAAYDITIDKMVLSPNEQIEYMDSPKALILKNSDWYWDTDSIKLLEQKD